VSGEANRSSVSHEFVPIARSLPVFLWVGAVGFLVDGGIMLGLVGASGWGPIPARAVSFPAALFCTWILNRRFAFRGRGLDSASLEYLAYASIQVVGALLNVGVFALSLGLWPSLATIPLVPLGIGAVIALGFNYSALRFLVYRRDRLIG